MDQRNQEMHSERQDTSQGPQLQQVGVNLQGSTNPKKRVAAYALEHRFSDKKSIY